MNNSARNSVSLHHPVYASDPIPYSPHAPSTSPPRQTPTSPAVPQLSSNKLRRSVIQDLPSYSTVSRRTTTLLPSSTSGNSLASSFPEQVENEHTSDEASTSDLHGVQTTTGTPSLGWWIPNEEYQELGTAYQWFGIAPNSRFGGLKRNTQEEPSILPWFLGNGHASQDWDALLMYSNMLNEKNESQRSGTQAFVNSTIPRRVLDIGGGCVPHWSLHMLSEPGWEDTRFVSLDAAPNLLPFSLLPIQESSRLSTVQHNFLERGGLPFEADRFDYVRISCVALGIPEHMWEILVEEVIRVLVPGGVLEIIESDFRLVTPTDVSESSSLSLMADALHEVFSRRWINLAPLSVIRPSLAINCKSSKSQTLDVTFPSTPPQPSESDEETRSRIILHAWALRLDGASHVLAGDLVNTKIRDGTVRPATYLPPAALEETRSTTYSSTSGGSPLQNTHLDSEDPRLDPKTSRRLEREVRDAVGDWAQDLVEKAGLARLVEQHFDWYCAMDHKVEMVLEESLPMVKERIRQFELEDASNHFASGSVLGASRFKEDGHGTRSPGESEDAFARKQLALIRSDAEAELRAVKKRLGRNSEKENWDLGKLRMESWIAVAPSEEEKRARLRE